MPAVTTRVGSASEVVLDGTSGFVTAPLVSDLAAAVARLLTDSTLRTRMGRAAREHATARFGVQRLVQDTELLYDQLLERPNATDR